MKFCHIIILSTVLLNACTQPQSKKILDFNNCPQYSYTTRVCEFEGILYPMDLAHLNDSILAVYDPKGDSYCVKIFNIDNQRLINSLCNKGEGPNDYLNPRFISRLNNVSDGFAVGDIHRINHFATDSISLPDYNGNCILLVNEQMALYNYMLSIDDSLVVYSQTGTNPITKFIPSTDEIKFIDYIPDYITDEVSPLTLNMEIYDAVYACNNNVIAKAYKNWNQIDLINIDNNEIKHLRFPDYQYNKNHYIIDTENKTATRDIEAKIFFTKIKTTNKYIFALNWDSKPIDVRNGDVTSTIYQIDFSGTPVASYTFDVPVSNFAVDELTNKISFLIGIADDNEIHILEPQNISENI